MASHAAAGDPELFVDALDELRRALPDDDEEKEEVKRKEEEDEDEEEEEFHDALDAESAPHPEEPQPSAKVAGCSSESVRSDVTEPEERSEALEKSEEQSEVLEKSEEQSEALEKSEEQSEALEKSEEQSEALETSEEQSEASAKSEAELEAEQLQRRQQQEEALPEEELEQRFEVGQRLKAEGNELFRDSEFDSAIERYTAALEICPLRHKKERSIMLANRAACRVKKEELETALADCSAALTLHPGYVKCLLRRAEVHERLEKLDEALADYQAVLAIDPGHGPSRMKCMVLPDKINERNEKMKAEMLGQLKNLGNMILKPFGLSTNNFQMVQDSATGGYSINFKQ